MNGVTMKGKKDENKEKIANNETKKVVMKTDGSIPLSFQGDERNKAHV
jgi:hypothetical protein